MKRLATAIALTAGACAAPTPPAPVVPTTAPTTSTTTTTAAPTATTHTHAPRVARRRAASVAPVAAETAVVAVEGNAGAAAQTARVSWYARGARTANGEAFDPDGFTTAHRTLPFGTQLRVCHAGRCVQVRVNDRGPALWTGRDLDLSRGAFASIAPLSAGVITATWEQL